nr:hypothetical protein [Anaerolineae bacterium]
MKPSSGSQENKKTRQRNRLGWTRDSYTIMGIFAGIVGLILYFWWPLAEDYLSQVDWSGDWWRYMDWLLIGIFLVMSLLIMAGANLKRDLLMVIIGTAGGLVIESWGTQTSIWTYYTLERPPLWIVPAWPIASLAIDRLVSLFNRATEHVPTRWFVSLYWLMMSFFLVLMIIFVWPTITRSLTSMSLGLSILIIATPKDIRMALITFMAGTALGYFLELWGTTRLCWTYYTLEQPPLFAVMAHGMAALAFWRVKVLAELLFARSRRRVSLAESS